MIDVTAISQIITQIVTQLTVLAAALYGLLALIVKVCPTIPAKFPILVKIIKWLGQFTNNQIQHDDIRAKQK